MPEIIQSRRNQPALTNGNGSIFWTNPSIEALSKGEDPIAVVSRRARELVFKALEDGWQGPPFDPFWLATYRKIPATPRDDIPDARLVPDPSSGVRIEFNPNQPHARVRFSLAHEIGHTLFPDCNATVRNRLGSTPRSDDWQLELLCNVAAAEILIPPVPELNLWVNDVGMENFNALRRKFDVSPEALLLRIVRLTSLPISAFAASRIVDDSNSEFRLDYCITSGSGDVRLRPGMTISKNSILRECTAIGFTAKGTETWKPGDDSLDIECLGVPPYPRRVFPRVIGLLRKSGEKQVRPLDIERVYRDITQPRGEGRRIIAHIVNDRTPTLGAGVALAIATRWPHVQEDLRKWASKSKEEFKLGNVREFVVSNDLSVVSMIAQHGYGASSRPRIRYGALSQSLSRLATIAMRVNASVHMPRIGTGFAGGSWDVIEQLIREALIGRGISVTVYLLPRSQRTSPQASIHSFAKNLRM